MAAGRLVLKKDKFSLKDVADAVVDPLPDLSGYTETLPFPPLPKAVALTPKVQQALALLPSIFGKVNMTSRTSWTDKEVAKVYAEDDVITTLETALKARKDALREGVRTSMDIRAEEAGIAVPKAVVDDKGNVIVAATPRDAAGHYILSSKGKPERLDIVGTNKAYSKEFKAGGVTISEHALNEALKDGSISREDYLSFTKAVRVFDEDKAKAAIIADDSRLAILRLISSRSGAGTSLFVRDAN
jgi:hypothetical protein